MRKALWPVAVVAGMAAAGSVGARELDRPQLSALAEALRDRNLFSAHVSPDRVEAVHAAAASFALAEGVAPDPWSVLLHLVAVAPRHRQAILPEDVPSLTESLRTASGGADVQVRNVFLVPRREGLLDLCGEVAVAGEPWRWFDGQLRLWTGDVTVQIPEHSSLAAAYTFWRCATVTPRVR